MSHATKSSGSNSKSSVNLSVGVGGGGGPSVVPPGHPSAAARGSGESRTVAAAGAGAAAADSRVMADPYRRPPHHLFYGGSTGGPGPYASGYGGGAPPPPNGHLYGSGGPHHPIHGYTHPSPYMPYHPNGYQENGPPPPPPPPPPGFYSSSLRGHPPALSPYAALYAAYGDPMIAAYGGGQDGSSLHRRQSHPSHAPSYPARRSSPAMVIPPDTIGSNSEGLGVDGPGHKRNANLAHISHGGQKADASQPPARSLESKATRHAGNMVVDDDDLPRSLHLIPRNGRIGRIRRSDGPEGSPPSSHPKTIIIPANPPDHGGLDDLILADPAEVDRLRAAAATEITPDKVPPIQTDFHFFVKDRHDEYRKLSELEVLTDLRKRTDPDFPLDSIKPMLINTNLNNRLMRGWEKLSPEDRESYMEREEEDRKRFMEEDEIASRHCATLTARGKSPRTTNESGKPMNLSSSPSPPISAKTSTSQLQADKSSSVTAPATSTSFAGINGKYSDEKKEEHPFEEKKDDMYDRMTMSGPQAAESRFSKRAKMDID